jgi:hypothetical protein
VADHVVGIGHLGQVLARCTGLLALLAVSGPTLGTRWRRWLREPLGRRRHRGVARVAFESLAKIGNLCPKCGDLLRLVDTLIGGRVWLVRLRRGTQSVVIAAELGRSSADFLAGQINELLATRRREKGAAIN